MKHLKHPIVRRIGSFISLNLRLIVAILGASIVATLTVDLGPAVRGAAESAASRQLERPVHIGRLGIHILFGRFVVEDLSIGGLHQGDRPFFTAEHLSVSIDWLTALRRKPEITITSVELAGWQMLVEKWDGQQSFPRLTRPDDGKPAGPQRFTTTLRYVQATRGLFTYEDHESPWSIVCRNLNLTIGNLPKYHGEVTFTGGTVTIQDHLPMATSMKARFELNGPQVHLDRIDLDSDGATSVARGNVDFNNFPEMAFDVQSRVGFKRMREIFFTNESWDLSGDGSFAGKFHLFKGGHELTGAFKSDVLGVNTYRFPELYGALRWTDKTFDVWNAGARAYGGDARFTYAIRRTNDGKPALARFDTNLTNVDLATYTDVERFRGTRFAGAMSGHLLLEWPLGGFSQHHGDVQLTVVPPPGVLPMTTSLAAARTAGANYEWGPFAPVPLPTHLPIAGDLTATFGADDVNVDAGHFISERTHVTFRGTTAYAERSRLNFHVTSSDWQESESLLSGIITDFGSPTQPVAFGGFGEFDGVMTGPFHDPRVEGTFSGEGLRAWDTVWGDGTGHIVFQNHYIDVADGVIRHDGSEIRADGRFSTGYPRDDHGEEMDARFRLTRRDLDGLRHAFQIDEYPVTGRLSGEFHLTGGYEHPFGFGAMTIEDGKAYGEPFEKGTASLRFEGAGVRLDNVQVSKSSGSLSGAAYVGWDSTYSFNADAVKIPVEHVAAFTFPKTPLSGVAEFTAGGSGTFDVPRYDVRFRVADLTVLDESIGQMTGTLARRGNELSGQVDASSPRLSATGTGRIAMTPQADADITLRFHDSALDPYLRLFSPKFSTATTAVASGSMRIVGELANVDHLLVDGTVDTLEMRLFDYVVRNAAPVRLTLDQRQVNIEDLELVGEDTRLRVAGTVGLGNNRIALLANGDANLAVLQGFFRNVRGSGRAVLTAAVNGPLDQPVFSGSATIAGGRIRHFSIPNSLDAINGRVSFDARGIRLDDVTATFGEGPVQFGGRIGFDGYVPGDLDVTVRGEGMQLRVPEGVRSTVDADLTITGSARAPLVGGTVMVRNALWTRRIDAPGSVFDLARRASAGGGGPTVAVEPSAPAVPIGFDLRIVIPSALRVETELIRLTASADLTLLGTLDRPVLSGHADVDRGEVSYLGQRYRITRGSIDFNDPTRIDPFFDVEAETTVRVPGASTGLTQGVAQTYRITVGALGTIGKLQVPLSSDPPLPGPDVLALLLSDVRRGTQQDAEVRARLNPNQASTDILTARATEALTAPLSTEVGRVAQTFGVDTFQLTPSLVDPLGSQTSRLSPTARLIIGKRISDRVFLTFSRSFGTTINDQVVMLEVEATDRLSWLLSRNEDQQTYALEFRVRRSF